MISGKQLPTEKTTKYRTVIACVFYCPGSITWSHHGDEVKKETGLLADGVCSVERPSLIF